MTDIEPKDVSQNVDSDTSSKKRIVADTSKPVSVEDMIAKVNMLKNYNYTPKNVVLVAVDDIVEIFNELQPYTMSRLDDVNRETTKARIDERQETQNFLHGITIIPENSHLFDVLSSNNNRRINQLQSTLKEGTE